VDIRTAGIESHLEAQRLSSLQHPDKLIVGDDFLNPTASYLLYYIFAKQRYAPPAFRSWSKMALALATSTSICPISSSRLPKVCWSRNL